MQLLIRQLQQLGVVAVVMAYAFGGTVGILKIIKKLHQVKTFQNTLFLKLEENEKNKRGGITMLRMILSVPVIMACSLGGTVGILKIIKKVTPSDDFPKDTLSKNRRKETQ